MENRTSSPEIHRLEPNEIFVFGSNLAGRHGKGAALHAMKFGAKYGQGIGLQGRTYGIPTKTMYIKTLPIYAIQKHVNEFIKFAKSHPELTFLVVEIGCMLAGYEPTHIAPLFEDAIPLSNVKLPESFWQILLQS
jgi:hypothetical protein